MNSGLDGELASHYYINGVTAGIYEVEATKPRSAQEEQFKRVDPDSGDTLPEVLSAGKVKTTLEPYSARTEVFSERFPHL